MEQIVEKADELRVQAKVLGTPLEVREILDEFILITYDIPCTEEGNKARAYFLEMARRMGAVQHTESVYYMPWTQSADVAALVTAKAGRVYVWYTKADDATAKLLTAHYDVAVIAWIDDVRERLERISHHIQEHHFGLAENMLEKTVELLLELDDIVARRRGKVLRDDLGALRREIGEVASRLVLARVK